ncbi:MAG: NAD(P)-dependent oxidoreductase [Proteobacteria bacterium]|nr:NAD(P)-dependent oxidoreductase [Pseudomonadota bacterium]
MRVFVTGASGFIGSHVTRALLGKGHSVAVLAPPDDPLRRLQDIRNSFEVITGMLGDVGILQKALAKFQPEACIHLAWYAEPGQYLHSMENIQSLTASLTLLNVLINVGCRQVVMAGTCAEYDTEFGYLSELTPTRPATLYAAAKLSCCLLGQQIATHAKINFAWGRIFYPYGSQEDKRRLIPSAIDALKQGNAFPATQGEQVRDYIHVEDVAEAFCVLTEKRAVGVFNISSGLPVSIHQLLETIGNLMGRAELIQFGALSYRDWEPPFICGNNSRLKNLGWKSSYSLVNGLSETIAWASQQRNS